MRRDDFNTLINVCISARDVHRAAEEATKEALAKLVAAQVVQQEAWSDFDQLRSKIYDALMKLEP